jgi:hypothetical protein
MTLKSLIVPVAMCPKQLLNWAWAKGLKILEIDEAGFFLELKKRNSALKRA